MKIKSLRFLLLVFASLMALTAFRFPNTLSGKKPENGIQWMPYTEAAKLAVKKNKKIFIDVYTDWCGWCKRMDATTMKDPKIIEYMNKKFVAVKLNAEGDAKVMYKGKQVSERELAALYFKASAYPTTVYLDNKENLLQPVPGFMDVPTLDKILHFYGEDYNTRMTWQEFERTYTGSNP